MRFLQRLLCVILLVTVTSSQLHAQLTDERVRRSIEAGKRYLLSQQEANGSWHDGDYHAYPAGVTMLCTLALLNAGMTPKDPQINRALNYIRKQKLNRTYTVALQTIVLCNGEPAKDLVKIKTNVGWLTAAQATIKGSKGAWGYGRDNKVRVDPSNAQFALLALYEADRVGVPVKGSVWKIALDYWKRIQAANGSFSYAPGADAQASGSMTCAGIGSMIIASGQVNKLDAKVDGEQVQCCVSSDSEDDSIEKAFEWLAKHFSVRRNPAPSAKTVVADMRLYYYLYALERVGRLAGRRFIGEHDWYREGVEVLIDLQDELEGYWNDDTRLTCTSFALLFLSKGRRPILVSKIKRAPEDDWNHHRHDVAHLTSHVEKRWKQDLTWQVVDLGQATAEDLWQSPVLFISGRDALEVAQAEKEALQKYVELGGFVFAENCCEGDGFDRDFRALMEELFPKSKLELLHRDHAIWHAEQKVDHDYQRPLLGLDACCRTGVVYCPENLSCYWELAKVQRGKKDNLPPKIRDEVDACLAIGANVVTYATGRELKQKLDNDGFVSVLKSNEVNDRAALHIAKLTHNGGSDDAQAALSNVLAVLGSQTQLPVSAEKRLLSPLDKNLPDYPIAFVHGRRSFRWSAPERKAIRDFVQHGGVIFGDAICADGEFAKSFREEIETIFKQSLERIPTSHRMFTSDYFGHDLQTVKLRDPSSRARGNDRMTVRTQDVPPLLEGLEMNGRFVVMFSPYDLSCALENRPSLECKGYTREDAAKIATNIVLYAMQQ